MHPYTRRRAIVEHVNDRELVSLHDLATLVGASEATVRRDLRDLDQQGAIVRLRGGASRLVAGPQQASSPAPLPMPVQGPAEARAVAVGDLAAQLVEPGDALAIGAGPGARELAAALGDVPGLTVVTNSLVVAVALASTEADVIVTGGSAESSGYALVGSAAESSLQGIRVRYAFIPADGLTPDHGLTSRSLPVASVNRALALAAERTVALTARDAVGHDSVVAAVPPGSISVVVTDAGRGDGALAALESKGATVRAVDEDEPEATELRRAS